MTKELRTGTQIATLVFAAVVLTYPFVSWGLIPGHDRRAHVEYQHFFNEQIAGGDLYPRWMSGLNQGRGSPIFFVQYPLPYYIAWGFGHLIPNRAGVYTETHELGLGVVLAAILGALFAYAWCTTFVHDLSAMMASIVFLTLPYFFSIDLYLRAAVGEIWAMALMPLAFYFMERRSARPRRALAGLAVAFALMLVSHLFTAVLFVPVLLAYAGWRSEPDRRFSAALQTASALMLGTAVAGVYILTVFAHRHFLHPENILTLGAAKFSPHPGITFTVGGANFSPLSQLFPYNASMFPDGTRGWRYLGWSARCLAGATISLVGYAYYRLRGQGSAYLRTFLAALSIVMLGLTILAGHLPGLGEVPGALPLGYELVERRADIFLGSFLTLVAALLCYWSLRRRTNGALADFLLGIALLSFWMMTRWSLIIWNTIHAIWNVQFPWRFNVLLALATTGLAALAISNLWQRPLRQRVPSIVLAIAIWGLVAGGTAKAGYVEDAFWGTPPAAYEPSPDPALPVYAQVKNLQEAVDVMPSKEAGLDVIVTAGRGKAKVKTVHPRLIELHATCEGNCTLRIGQFYYPAWRAKPAQGGAEFRLRAASPGGLMEISLPPGENDVVIELPRGWSEKIGPWVSLLSLMLVVALALTDKPLSGQAAAPTLAAL